MAAKKKSAKKSATRRGTASKRTAEKTEAPDTPPAPEPAAEPAAPPSPAPAEDSPGAEGGLRRGRRRRLPVSRREDGEPVPNVDIPPLPDDADVPLFARPAPTMPPPTDEDPRRLLDRVRRGLAHVSELGRLPEDALRRLAREEGLPPVDGERITDVAVRLVTHRPPRVGRNGRDLGARPRRERFERETGDEGVADAVEAPPSESVRVEGLLELHPDGYGFLRRAERGYAQHPEDVFVPAPLLRQTRLDAGHLVVGLAHRPRPGQAWLALHSVEEVNHQDPAVLANVVPFKDLTVVYPDTRLPLEVEPTGYEMRIMDLFCPVGRGQRGLIVAPPRSGKTVLLTKLADAIAANSPDVDIVVLLVDERPEEVTNMRRSVRGEVIASTFDKPAANHVRVAELVVEKVKRMVEFGRHVVLLLDSITRLGRAYNNMTGGSGRILTGGLDANALTKPKRFFGSARNVEGGGSLTIIASALIDTGSRLDQVIFEEFKGTGNMECVLSRELSNARIWPAIDVPASGTRNEDLLLHPDEMASVVRLRRAVTNQPPDTVMQTLLRKLKEYPTNAEFLMALSDGGMPA